MKHFLQHKRVLGSILLAFFFLTSSGFTVIVSRCTMAAVPMCCAEKEDMEGACLESVPAVNAHSIHSVEITCHVNTVVSSLNTTPATVEKTSLLKISSAKGRFFAPPSNSESTVNSSAVFNIAFAFQHTSPPSVANLAAFWRVEKRILLSSFLI